MIVADRKDRFNRAIAYLQNEQKIDVKDTVRSISDAMSKHPNSIRYAMQGNDKYLTYKFIRTFCSVYNNIISPDWLWEGKGMMLNNNPDFTPEITMSVDSLMKLTREELVSMVQQLMTLHHEQTELYRNIIRQNEQMIRNEQDRFNNITNVFMRPPDDKTE